MAINNWYSSYSSAIWTSFNCFGLFSFQIISAWPTLWNFLHLISSIFLHLKCGWFLFPQCWHGEYFPLLLSLIELLPIAVAYVDVAYLFLKLCFLPLPKALNWCLAYRTPSTAPLFFIILFCSWSYKEFKCSAKVIFDRSLYFPVNQLFLQTFQVM